MGGNLVRIKQAKLKIWSEHYGNIMINNNCTQNTPQILKTLEDTSLHTVVTLIILQCTNLWKMYSFKLVRVRMMILSISSLNASKYLLRTSYRFAKVSLHGVRAISINPVILRFMITRLEGLSDIGPRRSDSTKN